MNRDLQQISKLKSKLGEGIFFDGSAVYWVDIESKRIFSSNKEFNVILDFIPSVILSKIKNRLLVGANKGIYSISSQTIEQEITFENIFDSSEYRLNDGCLLRDGSYLLGFMHQKTPNRKIGGIFHVSKNKNITLLDWNCKIPNTFIELENSDILITDSSESKIYRCTLDIENKKIYKKVWNFCNKNKSPDGGCIIFGNLLAISIWDGSCINIYNENGKVVDVIRLPFTRPTNCAYDAKNSGLYITSAASIDGNSKDIQLGGHTFKIKYSYDNFNSNKNFK